MGIAGEGFGRQFPLVHPVAAVGVLVHLLQQHQVGIQFLQGIQGGLGVFQHRFPAQCPAVQTLGGGAVQHLAGVHKEGIVRPVSTEPHVAAHSGVRGARGEQGILGAGHFQDRPVLNAVVLQLQVSHISRQDQHRQPQHHGQHQQVVGEQGQTVGFSPGCSQKGSLLPGVRMSGSVQAGLDDRQGAAQFMPRRRNELVLPLPGPAHRMQHPPGQQPARPGQQPGPCQPQRGQKHRRTHAEGQPGGLQQHQFQPVGSAPGQHRRRPPPGGSGIIGEGEGHKLVQGTAVLSGAGGVQTGGCRLGGGLFQQGGGFRHLPVLPGKPGGAAVVGQVQDAPRRLLPLGQPAVFYRGGFTQAVAQVLGGVDKQGVRCFPLLPVVQPGPGPQGGGEHRQGEQHEQQGQAAAQGAQHEATSSR